VHPMHKGGKHKGPRTRCHAPQPGYAESDNRIGLPEGPAGSDIDINLGQLNESCSRPAPLRGVTFWSLGAFVPSSHASFLVTDERSEYANN
jgi:hypothetical protein